MVIASVIIRFFESEHGTVGAAAALAVPLLLCGIYGSLEIGRYAYAQGAVMYSAEETARFATQNTNITVEDLRAVASGHMKGIRQDKVQAIKVSGDLNAAAPTKLVAVEIEYRHDFIMPIFHDSGITIRGSATGPLVAQ